VTRPWSCDGSVFPVKIPLLLTIRSRIVKHPPLVDGDTQGNAPQELVETTVIDCQWSSHSLSGKEARELTFFGDFAKTEEFWNCVEELMPDTPRTESINIEKNSDGDDPPDISIVLPSGSIGVELTDCSPIAACVAKVPAQMTGPAPIPGASDAASFREVRNFMARPTSLVEPHFTNLHNEQASLVSYLEGQIRSKDVPGNDILLLTGSFMGGWPESEFAKIARDRVGPRNIKLVILASQTRATRI
jgi:hypothetical protein